MRRRPLPLFNFHVVPTDQRRGWWCDYITYATIPALMPLKWQMNMCHDMSGIIARSQFARPPSLWRYFWKWEHYFAMRHMLCFSLHLFREISHIWSQEQPGTDMSREQASPTNSSQKCRFLFSRNLKTDSLHKYVMYEKCSILCDFADGIADCRRHAHL